MDIMDFLLVTGMWSYYKWATAYQQSARPDLRYEVEERQRRRREEGSKELSRCYTQAASTIVHGYWGLHERFRYRTLAELKESLRTNGCPPKMGYKLLGALNSVLVEHGLEPFAASHWSKMYCPVGVGQNGPSLNGPSPQLRKTWGSHRSYI